MNAGFTREIARLKQIQDAIVTLKAGPLKDARASIAKEINPPIPTREFRGGEVHKALLVYDAAERTLAERALQIKPIVLDVIGFQVEAESARRRATNTLQYQLAVKRGELLSEARESLLVARGVIEIFNVDYDSFIKDLRSPMVVRRAVENAPPAPSALISQIKRMKSANDTNLKIAEAQIEAFDQVIERNRGTILQLKGP
jgi:hypothetical protein